ncbi:hypothetical protein KG918_004038 [Salmonella enterica]|nr:hypothetical protein [Salmonella enterica]EGY4615138.1 hypothetical protein [Salmonella enterica]EGY5277044.1 hypothetical protein [Salmonella enterica]EHA0877240.1 hypothetical protein [Salmonella enterica]EHM7583668.1 hypothetical protein [Salmonella enterica]
MFADCLFRARQWAFGQTTAAERKAGKKKAERERVNLNPACSDFAMQYLLE